MKLVSVSQEKGAYWHRVWMSAGLHPFLEGIGCGTADFKFLDNEERVEAVALAGDEVLIDIDDEEEENR